MHLLKAEAWPLSREGPALSDSGCLYLACVSPARVEARHRGKLARPKRSVWSGYRTGRRKRGCIVPGGFAVRAFHAAAAGSRAALRQGGAGAAGRDRRPATAAGSGALPGDAGRVAERGLRPVITLAEVAARLDRLQIACPACDRCGILSIARLLAAHGPTRSMPLLLDELTIDCPWRLAGSTAARRDFRNCRRHFHVNRRSTHLSRARSAPEPITPPSGHTS